MSYSFAVLLGTCLSPRLVVLPLLKDNVVSVPFKVFLFVGTLCDTSSVSSVPLVSGLF